MSLYQQVRDAFAPGSRLSQAIPEFQPRAGQTEMALAVARTMAQGGALVVEAGTGVGKTYSYLVPALLSGQRVMLSTATKNLQDQLFGRDLPRLIQVLGLPVRAALLKGRGSYLCLQRLQAARQEVGQRDRSSTRALAKIEQWAGVTRSGDLAELPGLDERSPVIPRVTSTRENCLGTACPKFSACHVTLARREALAADVVVINHHLFFADLAVRESGMAELLPSVDCVVFDEAHQLNETGVQFLGKNLTTGQLLDFGHDLLAAGLQLARGVANWQELAAQVEHCARDLRLLVGKLPPGAKLPWRSATPEGIHPQAWAQALEQVELACEHAALALQGVSATAPDFARLLERAVALRERLAFFALPCQADSVRWVDVGAQLRLVESPLDIAATVQTRLLDAGAQAPERKSWVFTSATLGDDPELSWFTEPCGLKGATLLRVQSPFDYANQAALYVPRDLPKPADPAHSSAVAELVARYAAIIGGRTLVLTTTLRALRAISEALQARFAGSALLEILVQGQSPKRELMERFRQGAGAGRQGCILVASASFWEGVDVPGEALQMVVIDKLPFPPPNDPLVQARSQRLELLGRSAFGEYFVPEAAVALKQGAGRLIRLESDRGVLVVCDTRLAAMGYGRRLQAALPPMRRISDEEQMLKALGALTTASTRAQCAP